MRDCICFFLGIIVATVLIAGKKQDAQPSLPTVCDIKVIHDSKQEEPRIIKLKGNAIVISLKSEDEAITLSKVLLGFIQPLPSPLPPSPPLVNERK